MAHQLAMAGEDWLSNNDRKRQARAVAARKKAALDCAKKLEAAADALAAFGLACVDFEDGSRVRGADDGRLILAERCREYSGWLESVYGGNA